MRTILKGPAKFIVMDEIVRRAGMHSNEGEGRTFVTRKVVRIGNRGPGGRGELGWDLGWKRL